MGFEFGDPDIFDKIYENSYWGNGSGGGSSPEATQPYKIFLEGFIRQHNIKSIIDLGCGDWQFSQFLDFGSATYIGIDASNNVIAKNKKSFARPGVSFTNLPKNINELPSADLLVCKDVLMHLSTKEVKDILSILPRFKYALITNDIPCVSIFGRILLKLRSLFAPVVNKEIKTGDYRPLDPTKYPFNFKLKKAFEWKGSNLILGKYCDWKKRTYLHQ
ncbi:MAG: class I SAM-dependent methyltransferase [Cyanobacteria bacterium]|nr:class I SAM-dependent methyltransferase [Cyanobacteriota bacterium]